MLDQSDVLRVQVIYSDALFELGRYQKYLSVVDDLIESVIYHSVYYLNQEDLFQKLLFKKGASLYHSAEYDEAKKVLWELIKINPHHQLAIYLYRYSLIRKVPRSLQICRNIALAIALSTVLVIAVELLIIRLHFAEQTGIWESSRNAMFVSSVGLLIMSDVIHRLLIFRKVNRQVDILKSGR